MRGCLSFWRPLQLVVPRQCLAPDLLAETAATGWSTNRISSSQIKKTLVFSELLSLKGVFKRCFENRRTSDYYVATELATVNKTKNVSEISVKVRKNGKKGSQFSCVFTIVTLRLHGGQNSARKQSNSDKSNSVRQFVGRFACVLSRAANIPKFYRSKRVHLNRFLPFADQRTT